MNATNQAIPKFDNPPAIELAVGLQFDTLAELAVTHLGVIWSAYRDRYPQTEHHPPLPFISEIFPGKVTQPMVRFEPGLPVPRCWFLNEMGTRLVQIQQDWFFVNWRRLDTDEPYPSYDTMKGTFREELATFQRILTDERIGELVPNLCEVTYVNHIPVGEGWEGVGELNRVVALWNGQASDEFLDEPEDLDFNVRYAMRDEPGGDPVGRLYVKVNPAVRRRDSKNLYVLNITARARPETKDPEGTVRCLDKCHEWAVRGFTSITTDTMHEFWKRRQ